MFDSHCHLNFEAFKDNFRSVIAHARDNGVTHFMVPGTDFETSKKATEIAEIYKNVFAAVGIHPTQELEKLELPTTLLQLEELLQMKRVMAIGEIGIDLYWYKAPLSVQTHFFEEQLKLAVKFDKSVIVHNRLAADAVIASLTKNWSDHFEKRLVLHCSEASEDILLFAKNKNIFIGVDGDVTFDSVKMEFIKTVPLSLLVIETDSPYIVPEPLKSQKQFPNVPSNILFIAQKVAELKEVSLEEVKKTTFQNACTLFGITT